MKAGLIKSLICIMGLSLVGCASTCNVCNHNQKMAMMPAASSSTMPMQFSKSMDESDNMKMSHALANNANGKSTYWKNQSTGNTYKVTPMKPMMVNGNTHCREYRFTSYVNGKKHHSHGIACMQQNGMWQSM